MLAGSLDRRDQLEREFQAHSQLQPMCALALMLRRIAQVLGSEQHPRVAPTGDGERRALLPGAARAAPARSKSANGLFTRRETMNASFGRFWSTYADYVYFYFYFYFW
jgi:hypothetical protein